MSVFFDGGWGWFVVLGSFFLYVIVDGIVYFFGVFYMEFLIYFKGGKGEIVWVGFFVLGVILLVGKLYFMFICIINLN